MKVCCFCLDVRSGTIATGVFILITRTLSVTLFSTVLGLRQRDENNGKYHSLYGEIESDDHLPWYYLLDLNSTQLIVSVVVGCINLIFGALLLIGVKQRNKSWLAPWIVLTGMELMGALGVLIMTLLATSFGDALPKIISMCIGFTLQCYMMSCVLSYYKQLKASDNNVLYNAVPLNYPTNANTPLYSNIGGVYPQPHSFPNQLPLGSFNATPVYNNDPSYEKKPPSYDLLSGDFASYEEKPPPYEEVKKQGDNKEV